MGLLDAKDKEKLFSECMDKEKVILTCGIHHFSYGQKRIPTPGCKNCQMVSFMGLLANTPPPRRQEVLEMLEYSVHKLVEADKRGELRKQKFLKRPEVTVEKSS